MPNGMTKKLLKIKSRAETRIAPISSTRWHSGVILKKLWPPHPRGAAAG
jgi:hypothetical protein